VGAKRQPAQDELSPDDRKRVGLQRAVERGQHHDAATLHQRRDELEEDRHVRHMLDDFEQ
jgi:hypothetical protein